MKKGVLAVLAAGLALAFAVSFVWAACLDSDGGKSYSVKGTLNYNGWSFSDYCNWYDSNSVREYFCTGTSSYSYLFYTCAYGCLNGACKTNANGNFCINKCAKGTKMCNGDYSYACDDYEGDGCYEWGSGTRCPGGCLNGNCVSLKCTDSDGGLNFNVSGTTKFGLNVFASDICFGNYLYEFYCASDTAARAVLYKCPVRCLNGACTNPLPKCFDSDGGNFMYQQGTVSYNSVNYTDFCSKSALTEYFCANDALNTFVYQCSYGCANGRCLSPSCTLDLNCSYLSGVCGFGKCNLTSGSCYTAFSPNTTICRNSISECDAAESCSGSNVSCPVDVNKANGVACRGGICLNGVCTASLPMCTNDSGCSSVGRFCDGGKPFTCSLGSDGCLDRVNGTACAVGQSCSNGVCSGGVTGKSIFVDKKLTTDCLTGAYSASRRDCSGSDGNAFNTIQKGLNNATAGYNVYIMGGADANSADAVYNITNSDGIVFAASGTANNRITVQSYPGQTVVLQGNRANVGIVFNDFASFYTIRGLKFTKFKFSSTYTLAEKQGIVIDNCEFWDDYYGLQFWYTKNSVIRNSYFHHNTGDFAGVYMGGGADNITIENVESSYHDDGRGAAGDADGFAASQGPGKLTFINCTARFNSEDGFDLTAGDVTLINCRAYGQTSYGIKTLKRQSEDNNITIINTVSYNNRASGLAAGSGAVYSGNTDLRIFNSLFYNNGEMLWLSPLSKGNAQIYNTMFIHNGYGNANENFGWQYPAILVDTAYWNATSDYNFYFDNWDKDVAWSGEGSHSIKGVNPKLFSPVSGDFHLIEGSLAVDKGLSLNGIVDSDADGISRPRGTGWDIGAYERFDSPGNRQPVFTYSGPTNFNVNENQILQMSFPAADPDGDSLRYLIEGNVSSAMSIDNSGNFRFSPDFDVSNSSENKVFNLTIGVTDNKYYYPPSRLSISINVIDVNRPPVVNNQITGSLSLYYTAVEGRKTRLKFSISDKDGQTGITSVMGNLPSSATYKLSSPAFDYSSIPSVGYILDYTPSSSDVGVRYLQLNLSDEVSVSNYTLGLEVMPAVPYREPSSANIFYVDGTNGNDANDGRTEATAWRTIKKAKNTLSAGQEVLIRGGSYNEFDTLYQSGRPGQPIIFKAYPGEKVIIGGDPSQTGFSVYGWVSNIVLDGLTFSNVILGVNLQGNNQNISLVNLNITNVGTGINLGYFENNIRIENVIVYNVSGSGIYGMGANLHLYNVSVSDFGGAGIDLEKGYNENVNLMNSKIYDARSTSQFGIILAGWNVQISRTKVLNNYGWGAYLYEVSRYIYIDNSIFANTRPFGGSAFNLVLRPTSFELYNSVIYNSSQYGLSLMDWNKNNIIRNNIIYNNPIDVSYNQGSSSLNEDYNIFSSWFSPLGAHSRAANPLFVDAPHNDFRLQANSPAKDNGVDLSSVFNKDIVGTNRPQGLGWDVGAYEFVSGGLPSQKASENFSFVSSIFNLMKKLLGF